MLVVHVLRAYLLSSAPPLASKYHSIHIYHPPAAGPRPACLVRGCMRAEQEWSKWSSYVDDDARDGSTGGHPFIRFDNGWNLVESSYIIAMI